MGGKQKAGASAKAHKSGNPIRDGPVPWPPILSSSPNALGETVPFPPAGCGGMASSPPALPRLASSHAASHSEPFPRSRKRPRRSLAKGWVSPKAAGCGTDCCQSDTQRGPHTISSVWPQPNTPYLACQPPGRENGAEERIRTSTPLRARGPEPRASAIPPLRHSGHCRHV